MTKQLAVWVTTRLVDRKIVLQKDKAVVLYGMEVAMATVIGIALIILVSILGNLPWAWLFFLISFVPLRRTAGGYHANTHRQCYLVFTLAFALCVSIERIGVVTNLVFLIGILISTVIVIWLSPIIPQNKPLKADRKRRNRHISIWLMVCNSLIVLVVAVGGFDLKHMHFYYYGVLTAVLSLAAAEIKNKNDKGENRNEREST